MKKMTVHEVSELTGVSIRTLHYYDEIDLLTPAVTTDAGYRLYDDANLERLQDIMLFRELEFPLKDIKKIVDNKAFDRQKALDQQIDLLKLKRDKIDELLSFAEELKKKGDNMKESDKKEKPDFKVFDKKQIEDYAAEAKKLWGETKAYKEFEEKSASYTDEDRQDIGNDLMKLFAEFGTMMNLSPSDKIVQAQVRKLQNNITANWFNCTDVILAGLGQMYAAGGEMTDNIDAAGGRGCARFVAKAIEIYTK